jgi:hypothetical protein
MQLEVKFGIVILVFSFVLFPAGMVDPMNSNPGIVPVVSWSEPGIPIPSSRGGATRVNRDLGIYHKNDVNQFGDDRAYHAGNGRTEADRQTQYWTPETYGLQGDYWYDSR